jgi:tetratricopeptide (TPR) repeat protein
VTDTRQIRVFVSSPADARFERSRLDRVIERLNGEFHGVARLTSIRWETEFYKAHETFQKQIPEAAQCDLVVAIFRARLGTALPAEFPRMADGRLYPSGTAYEVLSAIENAKGRGFPDVYVFRFPQPPSVQLDDPKRAEIEAQWGQLKTFFDTWFRTPEGEFKGAFHTFGSTDEFETQVEALLRKWLEEKVLHGRSVVWPVALKGSPFRGLAAFAAKHAPVFFGRARDITKATDRIKDAAEKGCAFLLVDGASGAGKSSLIRAGLMPRLTAAGVVPSIDVWRTAVMRPGDLSGDPFGALAQALFVRAEDLPDHDQGRPPALPELAAGNFNMPEVLRDQLTHADLTALKPVLDALAAIERDTSEKGGYGREVKAALLLVVDQLDELFGGEITDDVRARFALLLRLLARSERVWIVATLRADLFDRYLAQSDLKQLKDDGASYDLAPLDAAELAEIVRAPAAAAHLDYETDTATGERLDERLLKDADRPDLLPLLQFTLNQLFEARATDGDKTLLTFAAYRALGGLEGAVDREAEAALTALTDAERARLPRLLRELAVPARDGTVRGTHAGFDIPAVSLAEAAHDAAAAKLVRALVDARILLSAGEGNQATVRLAHARVLDSWERAKKIVGDNTDFYRIRAEVEEQQRRWEAAGRSRDLLVGRGRPLAEAESILRRFAEELPPAMRDFIRRSGRRARLRQTVTAAAAVVFAIVALTAVIAAQQAVEQRQRADEQRQVVEEQRRAAEEQRRLAEEQRQRAEEQRRLAEEQRRLAEEQRRLAEEQRRLAEEQRQRAAQTLAAATATANALVFDVAQRFKYVMGVPAALIKDILDRAGALQQQLAQSGGATPELQYSEAAALNESVDVLLTIGDSAGAFTAADRARQIMESLLATNSNKTDWQQELSVSYEKLGDALLAAGRREEALAAYHQDLAVAEKLAASDPNNAEWQRSVAATYQRIGNVLVATGRREEALSYYRKTFAIADRLAASNPGDADWQRDLSVGHLNIGDVLLATGRRDEALAAYQKSLAIFQKLAASDPSDADWQRNLFIGHDRVGDALLAAGRREEALASYQKSLAVVQKLAASDRGNAGWQLDLSTSYKKIAGVLAAGGRREEALGSHQKSLAITERLAASDPHNAAWQRDLSLNYQTMGDMLVASGRREEALAAYQKSLATIEKIAASDPRNAEWQYDLQISIGRIGSMGHHFVLAHDFAEALEVADQAILLAPDQLWLYANRAHALMFLGRTEEARSLYLKYRGEKDVLEGKSWQTAILEDFAELRKVGLKSRLMDEIEKLFGGKS